MDWKFIFFWGIILLSLRITHQAANVVLGGVAADSSNWDYRSRPEYGIDGSANTDYRAKHCVSSVSQPNPWWRVDLRGPYNISYVEFTRRTDCCPEHVIGTEIRIGNSLENNGNNNPRCAVVTSSSKLTTTYDCSQMEGRYINLFKPSSRNALLQFCEVKVFATTHITGENMAPKGVATQSAEPASDATSPQMAIDALPRTEDPQETCASVPTQDNPWWELDLQGIYLIRAVSVISSGDQELDRAEIRIGLKNDNSMQRCVIISLAEGQRKYSFQCGEMEGRYVRIIRPGLKKSLTICDVQVYGTAFDFCPLDSCNRDYILIRDKPKTWFEAQSYCRERHTDLATLYNKYDLNRAIDSIDSDSLDFWIGLYEDDLTWDWSLSDGGYYGDSGAGFRNFAEGEQVKSIKRRCVVIGHVNGWKVQACGYLRYFFCYDGRANAPQTRILVKKPKNWTDAQLYCRIHHTDLLSVRNQAEDTEIRSLVPEGMWIWIGLSGDSWKWSDGSDSTFRHQWHNPDGTLQDAPNCVYVNNRKWNVISCNTTSAFLCSYIKKNRFTLRITSNVDMNNPIIQQQIQEQLENEMKKRGISAFKIQWSKHG